MRKRIGDAAVRRGSAPWPDVSRGRQPENDARTNRTQRARSEQTSSSSSSARRACIASGPLRRVNVANGISRSDRGINRSKDRQPEVFWHVNQVARAWARGSEGFGTPVANPWARNPQIGRARLADARGASRPSHPSVYLALFAKRGSRTLESFMLAHGKASSTIHPNIETTRSTLRRSKRVARSRTAEANERGSPAPGLHRGAEFPAGRQHRPRLRRSALQHRLRVRHLRRPPDSRRLSRLVPPLDRSRLSRAETVGHVLAGDRRRARRRAQDRSRRRSAFTAAVG